MRKSLSLLLLAGTLVLSSCASPQKLGKRTMVERGLASWYGKRFQGRPTASGERFDASEMTAAHRTLPFGTMVEVRSVTSRKTVVVRINDRGPHLRSRILDLSQAAAEKLGMISRGEDSVEIFR
jgi:rare lipoprotein A